MKRVISITLTDVAKKQFKFIDLGTLCSFAKKQSEFWSEASKKYESPNNHSYINSANHFDKLINLIDSWKDDLQTWDDAQLNQQLTRYQRGVIFTNIQQQWLWSGHIWSLFVNQV